MERSRAELDSLLARHGAVQRGIFSDVGRAFVMFKMHGRMVRLEVVVPENSAGTKVEWAAWRRLLLVTKAKLELVADAGPEAFEREFLASILLPNNSTVHQEVAETLANAYATGEMPPMLPAYTGEKAKKPGWSR